MKTAEYVTPKHPDKLCDRISDTIVDAYLEQDPMSRCAIEVMGGHKLITITGELTTLGKRVDYRKIVTEIVGNIDDYELIVNIVEQSPEIAKGVDNGGAGDQGIMVGYACNDNEDMLPQELYLARSLCKSIYDKYPYDGKTQVTLNEDGIQAVVVSFQNISSKVLEEEVLIWLAGRHCGRILCNPAGDWNIGGFEADTGLTGRKLIVDNYGPQVAIGGGCFSGKDCTKVDRSGAYMARKIAVHYLKLHDAKEVIVKLAYAIGVKEPVMASIEVDGRKGVVDSFDLTPRGIIDFLNLRKPQFARLASEGHFGTDNIWDR